MANLIMLENSQQLHNIKNKKGYTVIFKHSTRCSISAMAKKRFEGDWAELPQDLDVYLLDLLQHRELSNKVAEMFHVHHESPQLLLIKDGECVLDQSHSDIFASEVAGVIAGAA